MLLSARAVGGSADACRLSPPLPVGYHFGRVRPYDTKPRGGMPWQVDIVRQHHQAAHVIQSTKYMSHTARQQPLDIDVKKVGLVLDVGRL